MTISCATWLPQMQPQSKWIVLTKDMICFPLVSWTQIFRVPLNHKKMQNSNTQTTWTYFFFLNIQQFPQTETDTVIFSDIQANDHWSLVEPHPTEVPPVTQHALGIFFSLYKIHLKAVSVRSPAQQKKNYSLQSFQT